MGRIVSSVTVSSYLETDKTIRCEALVDTDASQMILPLARKDRLGHRLVPVKHLDAK